MSTDDPMPGRTTHGPERAPDDPARVAEALLWSALFAYDAAADRGESAFTDEELLAELSGFDAEASTEVARDLLARLHDPLLCGEIRRDDDGRLRWVCHD